MVRPVLSLLLAAALPWSAAQGCQVLATPVNFGNYHPFSAAPSDGAGWVEVECDQPVPFRVLLDGGDTGQVGNRRLQSARGVALRYNLYLDAARSVVWGDGAGEGSVFQGVGGGPQRLDIYGRIPPRQNASPGLYRDTVVITVEW